MIKAMITIQMSEGGTYTSCNYELFDAVIAQPGTDLATVESVLSSAQAAITNMTADGLAAVHATVAEALEADDE